MESGLPMLNCLLQQTLRSLCIFSDSSTNSSKWVYAVFWRILPRNYPPPKWDHIGGTLDRAKGNKRNWILVWEDGFCDFHECERAGSGYRKGRFAADIFFKMSHEVYNYGEGLVGKVAADNSHKWVFGDNPNENDPNFISSWNVSIYPQPRAWEVQFNSGIQTIAVVSVREGIIQLGSFDKVAEDLNLVISIQRKFSYLLSIPGIYTIQRPCLPVQPLYNYTPTNNLIEMNETKHGKENELQMIGAKRQTCEELKNHRSPIKSINLGYNSPQTGMAAELPMLSNSLTLLPSMSWKQQLKNTCHNINGDECAEFTAIQMIKLEQSQEENQNPSNYRF
ncbi:protein RICE SALT SENSITIVE 3-like [Olea europaea var. sylvestris]|uniref:protein RICE SALT SENSITIVE 3-like n=1 Tax=Olea europaea var. sylvestris TaxID=158386 RepID=UPI000C1D141B|nr:protein RICE SALT SENSITIVE 3-like [Olea europaea var. sylvestris]